ncbi:MAG: hypothetical protein VYE81_01315 [Planctomycetota bacterium]|nr:hypothetical protein [Planctomycetota bacterium]
MKRSLPSTLLLAVALVLPVLGPDESDESLRPERDSSPVCVPYAELRDHPGRFLGRRVRVRVQARGWVERWDPFVTRFGSEDFRALDAWADEQHLWLPADHAAPLARLFVRRESAAEWALCEARTFDRFELELEVRAVLVDRPWVEVLTVRPLAGGLSEGALVHAGRAVELLAKGATARAGAEVERALRGPLHEPARRALEELARACDDESP